MSKSVVLDLLVPASLLLLCVAFIAWACLTRSMLPFLGTLASSLVLVRIWAPSQAARGREVDDASLL